MPQPRSSTVRSRPRDQRLHRRPEPTVGVDGAVLDLVGRGVLPDVGARDRPGERVAHTGSDQKRTRPPGVWICTARMPGVPCGATHSTLTSSSGASTVSPSHSLTRCGSPAISRQARANEPSAPADGCSSAGVSHWMKKGSCGSASSPLTPICFQRSSVPSGRCRLPLTAGRPSRVLEGTDVVDRHDPAEPAAAERRACLHGLAERCLVGGRVVERLDDLEVGAVGEREGAVARAEARVDAAVEELTAQ